MSERKPNIILINCDDLGYGDLGCYGSTLNKTPNIDRLAEEGMLFTDFYATSPVCSPSRGSMLTGCYPPRIGFGEFDGGVVLFPGQGLGMSDREETIASVLRRAGYATMIVGKWHCGDQPAFLPTRHGFDHYYGLPYSNDMGRQRNLKRQGCPLPLIKDERVIQQQPDLAALTERYTEQAVGFIRDNADKPFFLYLAHMYVHLPHYAPNRFADESDNGDFGAVMGCLDWSVGALVHELKACGLDENTLIIFTSDNGGKATHGGANGPLRGAKASTWEGGMRVPCIWRWPGTIPAGVRNGHLACALDFFATLARIAGAQTRSGNVIDSLDISDMVLSGGHNPREVFFYYRGNTLEAVRRGCWKLKVRDGKDTTRLLFNLEEDIGERRSVYDAHPRVVAELSELMERCREDMGDAAHGIAGANVRPCGRGENPVTLTCYDPDYPYFAAEYDKDDQG